MAKNSRKKLSASQRRRQEAEQRKRAAEQKKQAIEAKNQPTPPLRLSSRTTPVVNQSQSLKPSPDTATSGALSDGAIGSTEDHGRFLRQAYPFG